MTACDEHSYRPAPHWRLLVAGLVFSAALASAAAAQGKDTPREAILELREQAMLGKAEAAAEAFEGQQRQARQQDRLVELVLGSGPALAALLTPETSRRTTDQLLQVYWQEVIPATRGEQRLQAVNDCGVLLLQAGEAGRALAMLTELDQATLEALKQADHASASQFLVNAGRAFEAVERHDAAARRFLAALGRDPGSTAALTALAGVSAKLEPLLALQAWTSAAQRLGAARRYGAAGEALQRALELAAGSPADDPQAAAPRARFVVELARYLGAAPVSRAGILERWQPGLARLAEQAGHGEAGELAADLLLVARRPARAPFEGFTTWVSEDERSALFARLLFTLGRDFEGEDPQVAAGLYRASWSLDRTSTETALYLAGLLVGRSEEVDPEARGLQELVGELFDEKNAVYRGLEEAAVGPERVRVLQQLAQLHAVLGSVYEAQGQWGSPDRVDSAVFQWQRSLDARRQLTAERGAPSPVLSAHLARAYAAADPGRWGKEALDHYIEAATGYLEQGQAEAVDVILDRARELGPEAGGPDALRLDALDRRLEELRRAAPASAPSGAQLESQVYQRLAADPEIASLWQGVEVTVADGEAVVLGIELEPRSEELVRRRAMEVRGVDRARVEVKGQNPP